MLLQQLIRGTTFFVDRLGIGLLAEPLCVPLVVTGVFRGGGRANVAANVDAGEARGLFASYFSLWVRGGGIAGHSWVNVEDWIVGHVLPANHIVGRLLSATLRWLFPVPLSNGEEFLRNLLEGGA